MKAMVALGIVLIVLGVAALAYQGITYTDRKKVLDVGPLQATASHQKTVAIPPAVGGVVVAAGVLLLVVGLRKHA